MYGPTNHSDNTKSERFQLRMHPQNKRIIERAAVLNHTTMSDFITQAVMDKAERVVTEQCHFFLEPKEWNEFCEALDAPPQKIEKLEKLLSEETVLDRMR